MTGLDLVNDALIEIAVVVTDSELNPLDEGLNVLVDPPNMAMLDTMNDFVTAMHETSGLTAELKAGNGFPLEEAGKLVLEYIRKFVPDAKKAPLAGNSVGTDRAFIARDLPELDEYLHYRIVDVSSIKELARRWYPRVYFNTPEKHGGHRALADIRESIVEMRYYREALFVAQPGPDTAAVAEIAARVSSED